MGKNATFGAWYGLGMDKQPVRQRPARSLMEKLHGGLLEKQNRDPEMWTKNPQSRSFWGSHPKVWKNLFCYQQYTRRSPLGVFRPLKKGFGPAGFRAGLACRLACP